MITGVRHAGIVVADLDAMLNFYALLGFVVVTRAVESGKHMDAMLGMDDVTVQTVKLRAVGGGAIELLHYPKLVNLLPKERRGISDIGLSHIALTVVGNIDDVYERLTEAGIRFIGKPVVSGACKVAFCFDVEGNAIELVENLH